MRKDFSLFVIISLYLYVLFLWQQRNRTKRNCRPVLHSLINCNYSKTEMFFRKHLLFVTQRSGNLNFIFWHDTLWDNCLERLVHTLTSLWGSERAVITPLMLSFNDLKWLLALWGAKRRNNFCTSLWENLWFS